MQPAAVITTPGRRLVFGGLLMWVMVAGTAAVTVIPVIATFVIDDFGISRTELGSLGAVVGVLGAFSSPFAGRVTDRIGGRSAAAIVLIGAAVAAALFAIAPVFAGMFAGAVVAAISGAGGNPSTNKLIAATFQPGRRGVLTGIKQTGPQIGGLLAGLLAPWGATAFGWRPTMVVIAGLLVAPLPLLFRVIPRDPPRPIGPEVSPSRLASGIWWVAVYGALLGFGGGAVFLLPLFIEESLGQTPRVAGLAVALLGGVAIAGRLQWARVVDRKATQAPALVVLASIAVAATWSILASRSLIPASFKLSGIFVK